ncbi:MAG: DUF4270 family protein [Ferruginibacter sp.]
MTNRIVSLALAGFLIIIFFSWSCTKLDTTTIGSDLLPAVDNINTFADTLDINTLQGVFDDSTKLTVSNTAENYVFGMTNDPLLGQTNATLFLQLKPNFYPYYYGSTGDTLITIDSVVLCLAYKAIYGDTLTPIILQVNAVDPNQHDEWDSLGTYANPSLRKISYGPAVTDVLGTSTSPLNLASLPLYHLIGKGKDSVINQIRIPLTNDVLIRNKLLTADSTIGIFSRDTLFRTGFNNGFAISMTSGNALIYTQLSDPMTRLEIHYKRKNGTAVPLDTSFSYFVYNNGANGDASPRRGAVADKILRTRNALPNPGDQEIYLQTAPGTYASLKIPGLTNYPNRIIHRAEIIMEEIPTDPVSDGYFKEPNYLYIDLVDSGTAKWKPIYHDLNPSYLYDPDYKSGLPYYPSNQQVDFSYYGGTKKLVADASAPGGTRSNYSINITRYVQQIATKQTPNYELRLYPAYDIIYPQYAATVIPYPNLIAAGRVRLGGGHPVDPKYRMRLRILYSNIK